MHKSVPLLPHLMSHLRLNYYKYFPLEYFQLNYKAEIFM